LSAANTFTASQTVIGNVTATNVSATGITGGVVNALSSNISGYYNTANGSAALMNNTMGNFNTASGISALGSNTTGTPLTCIGYSCDVAADGLSNATAIGAYAAVGESNALVLASTA
jgi:hypothetical protein